MHPCFWVHFVFMYPFVLFLPMPTSHTISYLYCLPIDVVPSSTFLCVQFMINHFCHFATGNFTVTT